MALYSFICENCNLIEDKILSIHKRNEIIKCSQCNQVMKRLISQNISFNFKGEGFYKKGWQ